MRNVANPITNGHEKVRKGLESFFLPISHFHFFWSQQAKGSFIPFEDLKRWRAKRAKSIFPPFGSGKFGTKSHKSERSEQFFIFPRFGKGKVCLRNEPYFFCEATLLYISCLWSGGEAKILSVGFANCAKDISSCTAATLRRSAGHF